MLFNARHMAILASISILANALPFDPPRQLVQRQKKYSVINVDGGATQPAQATVVEPTKTIEVVNPGPTVTQEVTTTVENAAPAPTTASSSSQSSSSTPVITSTPSTSSSSSKPLETPKPIFVTVTIPKDDGPTEYYDDGLWHTRYPVKTFEAAVAVMTPPASVPAM
jgi:hypothetical protein